MLEEIGRYDPYTDKFIKNTTTDRVEIGTDGNLYRLSITNGNEYLPIDELYTKDEVVCMLDKIKAEIEVKIEQEEFARSVFRYEEKDAIKAEQCTGKILAYKNVIKFIEKCKSEIDPQESEYKK